MVDHTLVSRGGDLLARGARGARDVRGIFPLLWIVLLWVVVAAWSATSAGAAEQVKATERVEGVQSRAADTPAQADAIDVVWTHNIPESLDSLRDILLDLGEFGSWFPAIGEWRVLEQNSNSALVYGRQSLPWPIRDRDYVVRYRWWTLEDGSFYLEAIAKSAAAPRSPRGVVRIESMTTQWRLRSGESGTETSYTYTGEVGGSLPDWVARIGWESRSDRVVQALAQEVARRARAQRALQKAIKR